MATLSSINNDVLLLISERLQVADIFSLRRTNRRLREFITTCQDYFAKSVAYNTFSDVPSCMPDRGNDQSSLEWLKGLCLAAAVQVLTHHCDTFLVHAGEERSLLLAKLRNSIARLINGFRHLAKFAEIEKEVKRMPTDIFRTPEDQTLRRRMIHADSMTAQDFADYRLTYWLIWHAFCLFSNSWTQYCWDQKGLPHAISERLLHPIDPWVHSFVLGAGPSLFWRAVSGVEYKADAEVQESSPSFSDNLRWIEPGDRFSDGDWTIIRLGQPDSVWNAPMYSDVSDPLCHCGGLCDGVKTDIRATLATTLTRLSTMQLERERNRAMRLEQYLERRFDAARMYWTPQVFRGWLEDGELGFPTCPMEYIRDILMETRVW